LASLPRPDATLAGVVRAEAVAALSAAAREDEALRARRLEAVRLLEGMTLPHRARHLWRYTDPARFLPAADVTAPIPTDVTGQWRRDDDVAGVALVAAGAVQRVELAEEARERGVTLANLHAAPAEALARLGTAVPAEHGFVEALNSAAWRGGLLLHVPAGVRLARPVRLRLAAPAGGAVALPRVLVLAGRHASFEVIEGHGGGAAGAQVLGVTEVLLEEGAEVRYSLVERWEPGVLGHLTAYAHLGPSSRFTMATAVFGGSLAKTDVGATLAGEGAESEIYGVAFGGETQHLDHHTEHRHLAGRTRSNLDTRVVVTGAAHSAYTGLIRIAPDAAGCEAYQENRNLLLSPDARAESIPELEISNEDVRCTHGATVAPLDGEQLFYLGSRGLPRNQAHRLIVFGFLGQTLARLPEATRERLEALVAARLHGD